VPLLHNFAAWWKAQTWKLLFFPNPTTTWKVWFWGFLFPKPAPVQKTTVELRKLLTTDGNFIHEQHPYRGNTSPSEQESLFMNDFTLDKIEHKRLADRLRSEVDKIANANGFTTFLKAGNEAEGWYNISVRKLSDNEHTALIGAGYQVQFQFQQAEYDGRKMLKVGYDMNSVMAANGLTMFLLCKHAFDKTKKEELARMPKSLTGSDPKALPEGT